MLAIDEDLRGARVRGSSASRSISITDSVKIVPSFGVCPKTLKMFSGISKAFLGVVVALAIVRGRRGN